MRAGGFTRQRGSHGVRFAPAKAAVARLTNGGDVIDVYT